MLRSPPLVQVLVVDKAPQGSQVVLQQSILCLPHNNDCEQRFCNNCHCRVVWGSQEGEGSAEMVELEVVLEVVLELVSVAELP